MEKKLRCFVIIGYGKKTSYANGKHRELDLNETFELLIKPVFDEMGIDCYRAMDRNITGSIDELMLREIKDADIALADLSTLNANVMWELGVRHALKENYTIMICEELQMASLPFDVNHFPIYNYVHSENGIPYKEVERFRKVLKELVTKMLAQDPPAGDSPVFQFVKPEISAPIEKLESSITKDDILTKIAKLEVDKLDLNKPLAHITGMAVTGLGKKNPKDRKKIKLEIPEAEKAPNEKAAGPSFTDLLKQADAEKGKKDFLEAYNLYSEAKKMVIDNMSMRDNLSFVVARQALCTHKAKPGDVEALKKALKILEEIDPKSSNDSEIVGIAGGIYKRLHQETEDDKYLDEAIWYYERGFQMKQDYFNGINAAYMLLVQASEQKERGKEYKKIKIKADYITYELLRICEELEQAKDFDKADDAIWVLYTLAEINNYLGDTKKQADYEKKGDALAKKRKDSFAPDSYYEQKDLIAKNIHFE